MRDAQGKAAVDPVEMVNLIRRDFQSSRWAAVLLAVIVAVGMAFWLPALSLRGSPPRSVPPRPVVSVLANPFDGQQK